MRRLLAGPPSGASAPDDNVADLVAMVAANRAGEQLLREFVAGAGHARGGGHDGAAPARLRAKVAHEIGSPARRRARFEDRLDDGTPICVRLGVRGRADASGLRRHRSGLARQPQRAARGRRGGGDLRAALAGGRAHPAQRRLPGSGGDPHSAGLPARSTAGLGGGRRQRRDLTARRRRPARRARAGRGQPGHDEQRDVRQRPSSATTRRSAAAPGRDGTSTAPRASTRT